MSTPPARTAGYFPSLDTLRAVGALAVLTTHTAFWAGDYLRHGVLGVVLARLDVGVAIFFVLSGFLLSRAWLIRAAQQRPSPPTREYFWHRFLRVVPLYVVTVLIAYLMIPENAGRSWTDLLVSLGLADTFTGESLPAGLTHMWSLAVEVEFYLVLPALMWWVVGRSRGLRQRRLWVLVTLLVATSVAWYTVIDRSEWGNGPWQSLPGYASWFAVGIALADLEVLRSTGGSLGRIGTSVARLGQLPGSCWAAAGALLLVAATPLAGPSMLAVPTASEGLVKNLLYGGIAGLVVLPAVMAPSRSAFQRFLSHRVLRHLGLISYGIFCLHLPVLHLVMTLTGYPLFHGHGLQIWVLTVALSLVAAELTHRLVELPAQRLRNWPARLRQRRERRKPSTTRA